jgi:hypothetical protein
MTLIYTSPETRKSTSFNTGRQFPNNNGYSLQYMGMPGKDGPASNSNEFALGRRIYRDYVAPETRSGLAELFNTMNNPYNTGRQTSDTIVRTQRKEVGKPIPQNSSDMYIQRRKMLAIGEGTTQTSGPYLSSLKGGLDINYQRKAITRLKAGGSKAPPRSASKAHGPQHQSILARKYRR